MNAKRNDKMRTNTILVLCWRLTTISFPISPTLLNPFLCLRLPLCRFKVFRRSILIFGSYTHIAHIVRRKNDGSSFAMPHFALAMAAKIPNHSSIFVFHPNGHISFHLYNGTYPIFFLRLLFWLLKRARARKKCRINEDQKMRSTNTKTNENEWNKSVREKCLKSSKAFPSFCRALVRLVGSFVRSSILSAVACGKKGQPPAKVCVKCACVCEYLCNTSYICPKNGKQ